MDLLFSKYYKKPTDLSCHSILQKKQFLSVQIEHKTKLQIAIALTTKYKFFHKYLLIFGINSEIYLVFQNIWRLHSYNYSFLPTLGKWSKK